MTRVAIVHYVGATAKSRSVVASLVADQRHKGHSVEVLDVSNSTVIRQDFPPSLLVWLLGHSVHRGAFAAAMADLGAAIFTPAVPINHPTTVRDADAEPLTVALESELLTYFRVDRLPENRFALFLRRKLQSSMVQTYWALDALWKDNPPDLVLVPNGRTSRQKAARRVADHYGIPVELYENGRARPNSYYLGATQPHDRLASQAELDSTIGHLEPADVTSLAERWITMRMSPTGGTNSFSATWASVEETHASTKTTAVFFASSFDEFLAFGPMWNIDSWSQQFDAFDRIMSVLEERGVSLVLRLHPNLGSKSRRYFLREVSDVRELMARHPGLTVHWHNAHVNSYELVKSANYVIVERSTIGLEASMLGKPVWVTQASQWDKTADVRQVLGPEQITSSTMDLWTADPYPAQRFAAYWMVQEHPLHYSWNSWSSWDPEKPPFRMKAALLAVKNPWNHKLHLLRLEWAKWRNSGFRAP
jgi:hypothetical protein